jgi:hypothetical protein
MPLEARALIWLKIVISRWSSCWWHPERMLFASDMGMKITGLGG